MHTRVLEPKHGPTLLVRPLRHGDIGTVMAVFERLSERSRRARFNGPKPRLSTADLEQLASVDSSRHALVAYVDGDQDLSRSRVSSATAGAPRSPSRWPTSTSSSASGRPLPRS